ncbi:hypothetical protein D3C80_1166260 [compost metagenome]
MTKVQQLYPAGHPRHIPDAWPALMSEDQLLAYFGGMSKETLLKVCPVPPVDLGANLLRYQREAVDVWVASLPLRASGLRKEPRRVQVDPPVTAEAANDRATSALERARARSRRTASCRKAG